MGLRGTLAYVLKERFFRVLSRIGNPKLVPVTYRLYSRELDTPLLCRYATSDRDVFFQVFIDQEYAILDSNPKLVIDCGANVGYTSAYFLARFPNSMVLAVEPEGSNFEVLCHNLDPYGNRVQKFHSAIWSHNTGLRVVRDQYRDGREWATQVRECRNDEKPDVNATSISSLLDRAGYEHVDILKLDIEGSEAKVFAENYEGWINKVNAFLIELHDEQSSEAFFAALKTSGEAFRFSRSGQITVAERLHSGNSEHGP